MAKRKSHKAKQTPPNFVDLRAEALKRNNNLIDDVIRPLIRDRKLPSKRVLPVLGILTVILVIIVAVSVGSNGQVSPSPVPSGISQSVNFPIYYPEQSKLPAGYSLNKESFSAGGGAVLYSVQIPQNLQITVTEQSVPSQQEIDTFHAQRLPLFTNVKTSIGTARVSALNNQSFTSLPTEKTWLLISAPYNIDSKLLNQFLNSLTL